MDAVEFVKTANRLCRNRCCTKCPLYKNGACMAACSDVSVKNIKETISILEQWAKDHPIKTRQSEFLKMFPNAVIDEDDGILCIRPCAIDKSIGCTNGKGCGDCYRKYWLTEVTDNGNVY